MKQNLDLDLPFLIYCKYLKKEIVFVSSDFDACEILVTKSKDENSHFMSYQLEEQVDLNVQCKTACGKVQQSSKNKFPRKESLRLTYIQFGP